MEYSLTINIKKLGKRKGKQMQEQLYSADMPVSPVRGSDLFITSGIIQEFLLPIIKRDWWEDPPGDDVLWQTLAEATKKLTGQEVIGEQPVPLNLAWERFLPKRNIQLIFEEFSALAYAVGFWLSPSRTKDDLGTANVLAPG